MKYLVSGICYSNREWTTAKMKLRISDWLQDIQHKQQGRAELKALMHFEIGPREVWHASEYKNHG